MRVNGKTWVVWRWLVAVALSWICVVDSMAEAEAMVKGQEQGRGECVILLHGMGRTSRAMWFMARAFRAEGYQVWSESYPSTRLPVEAMSGPHIESGLRACREAGTSVIHFVTHSLGGILLRHYLQDHGIPELAHAVMLAPPNRGSEVADYLRDKWFYRKATGPAGQQLGTGQESLPNRLAPVDASIGVIAGRRSSDPWFSSLFPGENDGKVAVERARLDEMSDFLVVDAGHTFIMNNGEVIRQTLYFLREGRFQHASQDREAMGGKP